MVTTSDYRVDLQPAFVLHQRAYRDTSAIIELFTYEHGRVAIVARGIKGGKKNITGSFQPFALVNVSWQGNGELKSFAGIEQKQAPIFFSGEKLISALYLNELLLRLLPKFDPYEDLFVLYQDILVRLASQDEIEYLLRIFEKSLLENLGYELNLMVEAETGEDVDPEQFYYFIPDQGPVKATLLQTGRQESFKGSSLLSFAQNDFSLLQTLKDAKRITRLALRPLLGPRPLKSRELFSSLKKLK